MHGQRIDSFDIPPNAGALLKLMLGPTPTPSSGPFTHTFAPPSGDEEVERTIAMRSGFVLIVRLHGERRRQALERWMSCTVQPGRPHGPGLPIIWRSLR